ncbi:MAG TPA: prepilin-type N-terminal cleavage/methylation domain-containing protein [Anaeromyxobacteraceae bacterium]|nr:prepilin-type N-terminal cleavage/methylation domain-containing protein [Anaeromyxobacteraceae bacterium]
MRARSHRGFTLIEVMIAIAITAVVAAMTLGAFQRAHALRLAVEEQDERVSGARTALSRMSREVSAAFVSEHYDRRRFRDRPTLFKGRDAGDRDSLLFASMAHVRGVRDAKESDQMVVEYSVEADPDLPGEYALFRREKIRIDDEADRGGSKALLLRHVTGFDVTYWDWQKQEWARDWSTAPGERLLLPTRVRMKLTLRFPDGRERSFETQARIAIIRPLDF